MSRLIIHNLLEKFNWLVVFDELITVRLSLNELAIEVMTSEGSDLVLKWIKAINYYDS